MSRPPRRVVTLRAGHQVIAGAYRRLAGRRQWHRSVLGQRLLGLPVLIENRLYLAHHRGIADAQPGFMDMFQGAPVEILAADKCLPSVHNHVFGVDDAAADLPVGHHAEGQVGDRTQAFQG